MRKAFGGAYIVMNSRSLGADAVFAWPTAELAVMGAEGAVDIIYRRALEEAPARRDDMVESYRNDVMKPEISAERLSVDEIIEPNQTRPMLSQMLRALAGASRPGFRHDNLPQ